MSPEEVDKEINELVNYHSKLDLAQLITEYRSSIDTLNAIIEKLKCCENCEYHYCTESGTYCKIGYCNHNEKWKMVD